jgi:DNA-binding NtrC family response regulator
MNDSDKTLMLSQQLQQRLTKPIRSIVIDDDPYDMEAIIEVLDGMSGFEVTAAVNGMSLRTLKELQFDVAFIDLRLRSYPSGVDLIKEIQDKSRVVIVTAMPPEAPDFVEALKLGATRFITKPVTPDKVVSALT